MSEQLISVHCKRSFLVARDFNIRIFFSVYFNWKKLKWLQICKFLIEIIFILFLNTTLFYNFMLPVNRYNWEKKIINGEYIDLGLLLDKASTEQANMLEVNAQVNW
jgi:hypothetical protein